MMANQNTFLCECGRVIGRMMSNQSFLSWNQEKGLPAIVACPVVDAIKTTFGRNLEAEAMLMSKNVVKNSIVSVESNVFLLSSMFFNRKM